VQVPSWHPQQLNIHLLKSKLGHDESQFNNLHFIKGAHPHQATGSKVPDFSVKKVLFFPPCINRGGFTQVG
jgi:hypothetical protein